MPRIAVERPRGVSGIARSLSAAVGITLVVLKLAGVIAWPWWWVLLSPLCVGGGALALLAGGLVIAWCLGRWAAMLANPFRPRRRRQN